jgi:hypothetical protein
MQQDVGDKQSGAEGAALQKIILLIVTAVRNSNLTYEYKDIG